MTGSEAPSATLTDDELKAIGRIAIRHALVGQIIEWSLWKCIDRDDDNIGANLTKGWRLGLMAEKLEKLAPLRVSPGEFRDALIRWIANAKLANTKRNAIIHAALTRFPGDEHLLHIRFLPREDEAVVRFETFNAKALNLLADFFDRLAEDGVELIGVLEEGDVWK